MTPPRRTPTKAREAEARIRGRGQAGARLLTRLQGAVIQATACATPSLRDLAQEAKISESTLSSWRRGTRVPPPDAIETLAAVLEDRSISLASWARTLREAAEDMYSDEGRAEWLNAAD